ncbi:uncharacterized protein LOC125374047 [Haliotis rufescens]|uniref:uncharacterized protein LOC125374047 n=1 Tax=Haliotis rufescens TaxID=6454 RepID=UPI00201EE0C0|nr:uncharacterized protein LOC125374047 [Haliotis rufescens]
MPPKRRAAVNHKLVRGAKQARTTRRQTPGVHIVQEATADGESANYGNIEGGNRINVQSAQLVNAAQAANSATQVNEQLEKILQLLEHSAPGPVSANQQVRLGFSSPAISPNIGRIPDAHNEADGDAAWPANHIAGYGDSLSFRADGIDAHVKQQVREKIWRGEYVDLGTILPNTEGSHEDGTITMAYDSSVGTPRSAQPRGCCPTWKP